MKYKILIGVCMILIFSSLASAWCWFSFIGTTCDEEFEFDKYIKNGKTTYENKHNFMKIKGKDLQEIDNIEIENIFEDNGKGKIKHTIDIRNKENTNKQFDYSHRIEIDYDEIIWGGNRYYLTSEPIELRPYYEEGELIVPNIFFGEDYQRINYKDIALIGGYALAYQDGSDYIIELRIDGISLKANENLFIDPEYSNGTAGFFFGGAGNNAPVGVGHNSTHLFVADSDETMYCYLLDGTADTNCNSAITLGGGDNAVSAFGISDSELLMGDGSDDFVFNYTGGVNHSASGFYLGALTTTQGGDSDKVDKYFAVDAGGGGTIHIYGADGVEDSTFDTDAGGNGNANPVGITANGSTIFVTDPNDKFIYSYDYSGNNLSGGFGVEEHGCANPQGITFDPNLRNLWVADSTDDFMYQFTLPLPNDPPTIPYLHLPENNSKVSFFTNLNWSNSTDADGNDITYILEVDDTPDFSSPEYRNASITEAANTTGDTPSGLNQGDNSWRVISNDGITNSTDWGTTRVFNYDTIAPSLVLDEPTNTTYTTNVSIELNYSANDHNLDYVWYSLDGAANVTLTANITIDVSDSNHYIQIWVNDTFGYVNTSNISFNINLAPTTPDIFPSAYFANYSFNGICENSTDEDGDDIYYGFFLDGVMYQNETTTTYSLSNLTNGTYAFSCEATDGLTNSTPTSAVNIDVDNTAIWNYSISFTNNVYENSQNNFYITVTFNNLSNYVTDTSVKIEYGGNTYTMTESRTVNNFSYSKQLTAPFSTSESFLFNISILYNNGSYAYENTANFTQTIKNVDIYDCAGVTNSTSIMIFNFTLWDEYDDTFIINVSNLSDMDIKMDMNYYLDDINNYQNLSIVASNSSNLTICMNPADVSYNHSTIVDYGGGGYDRRQYHFNKANFDNITDHINLYLLEISKATSTIITVEDDSGGALENYIVNIKKYFIGTDEHETIGMLKTNIDGQDHIYLQHNEPFYKFIITDPNNNIIYTSGDTKVTAAALTLQVGGVSWGEEATVFEDTVVAADFNNATRTFTLTYSKNADVDKICMKVTRERRSGTIVVGTKCSTETSTTLTQAVTGDGLFAMNVWEEKGNVQYPLVSKVHDDRRTYSSIIGTEGLFLTLLIILLISFAMIWSPTAAIFGSIIGIIISFMFGFLNIGIGSIIGLIIIGIILMIKSKV